METAAAVQPPSLQQSGPDEYTSAKERKRISTPVLKA
jgi:hypothetical protein